MVAGQKYGGVKTRSSSGRVESMLQSLATQYGFVVTADLVKEIRDKARDQGSQNIDSIRKMALDYLKKKQETSIAKT